MLSLSMLSGWAHRSISLQLETGLGFVAYVCLSHIPLSLCEVPSCRPLRLSLCSSAFLPTSPHDSAFISGATPQTLPQAHLLLQVRSVCSEGGSKGCLWSILDRQER